MTSVMGRVRATMRGSLTVELWSHKPYGSGSIPDPATRTVRRKMLFRGATGRDAELSEEGLELGSRSVASRLHPKGWRFDSSAFHGADQRPKRSKHSPSVGGT